MTPSHWALHGPVGAPLVNVMTLVPCPAVMTPPLSIVQKYVLPAVATTLAIRFGENGPM
jgi:hypothetical protein